MPVVSMKATIPASSAAVWETLRDFNGLQKFLPAITGSTVQGASVGAVRTLTIQGGAQFVERLEAYDEIERSFTYSIVTSPLPISGYLSTMRVRQLDNASCEVLWSSFFQAAGAPEAEVKAIIEGVYSAGFEGLRKLHGG